MGGPVLLASIFPMNFPHQGRIRTHYVMLKYLFLSIAALLPCILPFQAMAAGVWSTLPTAPSGVGLMMLQPDGTLLIFDGGGTTIAKLTPNAQGSYTAGTWTSLKSMYNSRLYFSSQVLKDGRIYVAGGEYGTGGSAAEVYNPLTNKWLLTPAPGVRFSDANSAKRADAIKYPTRRTKIARARKAFARDVE